MEIVLAILIGIVIGLLTKLYFVWKHKKEEPEEPYYEPILVWDKYLQRLQIRIINLDEYYKELNQAKKDPIVVDSYSYAVMANAIMKSLKWAYDDQERAIQEMTSGWWEAFTKPIPHARVRIKNGK